MISQTSGRRWNWYTVVTVLAPAGLPAGTITPAGSEFRANKGPQAGTGDGQFEMVAQTGGTRGTVAGVVLAIRNNRS